ncbi:MAG: SGNH/GDSL hydrolase family protein [Armatimonadetes bacterium]|nr:SGNH/GDSL hydrolase family protein [Armatimonadota bacterium]
MYKDYCPVVAKKLEGVAYCAKLATSSSVADPAFHHQLATMLSGYHYAVVHFNSGLHGFGYTEGEYRDGYEATLKQIREQLPDAKLILALTTPLQSTSSSNRHNPRVDERNGMARQLAEELRADINDLHSPLKDHPEYYRDPFHFLQPAIEMQAEQVAARIKSLLPEEKAQ